jgi:hypothetical protein
MVIKLMSAKGQSVGITPIAEVTIGCLRAAERGITDSVVADALSADGWELVSVITVTGPTHDKEIWFKKTNE